MEQLEIIPVGEKIGATLSKSNKSKLEKAITQIQEVIDTAGKEEDSEGKEVEEANTIFTLVEDKEEPEPQNKITLPVISKEELTEMVENSINVSLGKLK